MTEQKRRGPKEKPVEEKKVAIQLYIKKQTIDNAGGEEAAKAIATTAIEKAGKKKRKL